MMKRIEHLIYFFIVSAALLFNGMGFAANQKTSNQEQEKQLLDKSFQVGVSFGDPFVIINNNNYQGIAIDLWKIIAEELNLTYTFIPMGEHIDEAIAKLASGDIDILIGPIVPIYERSKLVDFMQPYYLNQIGLVVPLKKVNFLEAINPIFNTVVTISLFIFILFFLLYMNVYWYYERNYNKHVPLTYWQGIRKTFWLHTLDIDLGILPSHATTRTFRFFLAYPTYAVFFLDYCSNYFLFNDCIV